MLKSISGPTLAKMNKPDYNLNSFYLALALIFFSLIIGVIGFTVLEQYNFIEAVFMTVITLSTVGYTTIRPLSEYGMIFSAVYILFNLGLLTFTISVITSYVFEGRLQKIYKYRKVLKRMDSTQDHVIVCGLGRNGSKALEELTKSNEKCIVIEQNKEVIVKRKNILQGHLYIQEDAILDETLNQANIKTAKAIIISLPKDADNVFITLTARQLNPKIIIISRASEESTEIKLRRAGADHVVMPDLIGGSHMANLIIKPDLIRFSDILSGMGTNNLKLEEIRYEDLRPELKDQKLEMLKKQGKPDIIQIGFKNEKGEFTINPTSDLILSKGDTLIILGKAGSVIEFKNTCC